MIQEMLEKSLLAKRVEKDKRIRSGKFSPSSFGRCYRNQYWNRKNEPQSNPIKSDVLKVFLLGDAVHDIIQNLFPKEQCEIEINDVDIKMFADVVLENKVLDIKSCKSYEFKIITSKGYDISEKTTNCLQVMTYAYYLKKPIGVLVFVEKEGLKIKEFELKMSDWESKVVDEIKTLRELWALDKLPAGIPKAFGGKECKYCNWMDKCFLLDGDKTPKEVR